MGMLGNFCPKKWAAPSDSSEESNLETTLSEHHFPQEANSETDSIQLLHLIAMERSNQQMSSSVFEDMSRTFDKTLKNRNQWLRVHIDNGCTSSNYHSIL